MTGSAVIPSSTYRRLRLHLLCEFGQRGRLLLREIHFLCRTLTVFPCLHASSAPPPIIKQTRDATGAEERMWPVSRRHTSKLPTPWKGGLVGDRGQKETIPFPCRLQQCYCRSSWRASTSRRVLLRAPSRVRLSATQKTLYSRVETTALKSWRFRAGRDGDTMRR
jgi:hypothetical protein